MGSGEFFQSPLTDQASLDMVLDRLSLTVVHMLVEQSLELVTLVQGDAVTHRRSSLGMCCPHHSGGSFGMRFQVPDFTLEVPRHVAPRDEHRRDLHAQPRGGLGASEALDRRQTVGFPGVVGHTPSHPPLRLLEQFEVELRLKSTNQLFTRLDGLDRIGSIVPADPGCTDATATVGHAIPACILHQCPKPPAEIL